MIGKHEKALEYTNMEMDQLVKLNGLEDPSLAFCFQRLGTIYYGIGNFDKALENLY